MPLFSNVDKEKSLKLERFRRSFQILTADGRYPPERQNRLFQACKKAGLDWNEARQFVIPESLAFMHDMINRVVSDRQITGQEIANLRQLQRRLGLGDEQAWPVLDRLYEMVERKLEAVIIDRAAYLSSPALITILTDNITSYGLSSEREVRLLKTLSRQHDLAKLMAGNLPITTSSVDLYRDEICHLDKSATMLLYNMAARFVANGRLVVTNQRMLLLSPQGGFASSWSQIRNVRPDGTIISIESDTRTDHILTEDTQYVATLLAAARNKYAPAATPIPVSNKRLR
jgi:hypothetical protein